MALGSSSLDGMDSGGEAEAGWPAELVLELLLATGGRRLRRLLPVSGGGGGCCCCCCGACTCCSSLTLGVVVACGRGLLPAPHDSSSTADSTSTCVSSFLIKKSTLDEYILFCVSFGKSTVFVIIAGVRLAKPEGTVGNR